MEIKKRTKLSSAVLILFMFFCVHRVSAQLVLDGAYINISGGTSTMSVTVVVDQSSTAGITRLPSGGHIYTEGQYNAVQWNAGTGTGDYIFPFGVGGTAADYIPFKFNKTSSGSSNISVSTWYTDPQNVPHPGASNVAECKVMLGFGDSVTSAIDRFWDIRTSAFATANLTFSYRGSENTTTNPTDPTNFFDAQHWNGTNWDPSVGPGNIGVTSGIGSVGPVNGQTTFSPWVLTQAAAPLTNNPPALLAYAIPKKELDGGYYVTKNSKLNFMFDEEYVSAGTLQFTIYNENRDIIASTTVNPGCVNSLVENLGDNRYTLDCSLAPFGLCKFHTLEIKNAKNEVVKLRFYLFCTH